MHYISSRSEQRLRHDPLLRPFGPLAEQARAPAEQTFSTCVAAVRADYIEMQPHFATTVH